MNKLNFLTLLILLPFFATNLSVTLETKEQTTKNENGTISPEHGTSDGISQATALIITPNIHGARRRWRRDGDDKKKKQHSSSLSSSKSVNKSLLSSPSGKRLVTGKTNEEKKSNWTTKIFRRFMPSSREPIEERLDKLNELIYRLAFEVLRSENKEQIKKQKEVLKLAIYYEHVLDVLEEKLDEARDERDEAHNAMKKLIKLKKNTQAQTRIIAEAEEKVLHLRETKRKTKESIDKLIDLAKKNKEFIFAEHINELNKKSNVLYLLLEDWEKEIPYQYDRTQMKIWVQKHSTTHTLYEQAKANVFVKSEVTKLLNLLLIDAAFDLEARKKCLKTAFRVQFRSIAAIAISQKMEFNEIRENVCTPLSEDFHKGLKFDFDPTVASQFTPAKDWPKLADQPKATFGKDFLREFLISFNPYSARDAQTHQEELEEESDKYKWEMLNAKSTEERQKAVECVKAAMFIQMFKDKMYSEETAEHMNKTSGAAVDMKQQLKKSSSRKYRDRRRKRSDSSDKNTTDDDEEGEGEDGDDDDDDDDYDKEKNVKKQKEGTHRDDGDDDDDDGDDDDDDEDRDNDDDEDRDNDDDDDNDDENQLLSQASPARSSASSVAPSHRSMGATQRKIKSAARSDAESVASSRRSSVKNPPRSSTSSPAHSSASSVAPSHRSMGATQSKVERTKSAAHSDVGSVAPSRQSSVKNPQISSTSSPAHSSASSVASSHRSRKIELRQSAVRSDAGSVAPSRQSSAKILQRSATRSHSSASSHPLVQSGVQRYRDGIPSNNNVYEDQLRGLNVQPSGHQRRQPEQNVYLHRSQSLVGSRLKSPRMSRSESSRHNFSSRGEGSYEDVQITKQDYDTVKKEQKTQQEAHKLSLEMLRKSYDRMCNSKGSKDRTPLRDFYDYYNDMDARVIKSKNAFIIDILEGLKVAAEEEMNKSGHQVMNQHDNDSRNYRKEIEPLNKLLGQKMLLQFSIGPVKSFLNTMAILSKQMTAAELRDCMDHFRWFPACNVHANERLINGNGTGQLPPEDGIDEALKNMKIDENDDYMEFKTKILTEKKEFLQGLTAKEGNGTGTLSRSSSATRQRSSSRGGGPTLSRSVSMSSNASSARGMNVGNKSGGKRRSNARK